MHKILGTPVFHIPLFVSGSFHCGQPKLPGAGAKHGRAGATAPSDRGKYLLPRSFPGENPQLGLFCTSLLKDTKLEVVGLYAHNF